jgi:hypothetical protein
MRFSNVAAAVCLGLLPVCMGLAAPPPAVQASPAAPAAPTDAAARHARRAACLKDAKAKKLVGAEKTAFVKTCVAAP